MGAAPVQRSTPSKPRGQNLWANGQVWMSRSHTHPRQTDDLSPTKTTTRPPVSLLNPRKELMNGETSGTNSTVYCHEQQLYEPNSSTRRFGLRDTARRPHPGRLPEVGESYGHKQDP